MGKGMLDRPVDDDASPTGGGDAGDGKPGGEGPRRTGLLLCSLSTPAPLLPPDMIETATGGHWLSLPDGQPQAVADTVMATMHQGGWRALMLLSHEGAIADFTLQLRAVRRRKAPRDKAAAPITAPSIVRAPTPAAEILRALHGTDHEARTLQEEPEDDSSDILHSVLLAMDELSEMPGVVLLRLRAGLAEQSLVSGLSSVAEVMTRRSPLQSLRATA